MNATRAELQRRLAAEFDRRGWEYDLAVGPAIVDKALSQGAINVAALATGFPADARRRLRATRADVTDAISRAFSGVELGQPDVGTVGMRLLFVAAGPLDESRLRLDAEHRDIRSRIQSSTQRDQIEVEIVGAARATDLIDALNRTRPTILHLAGHGDQIGIALEDDHGMAADVSAQQLLRLVGSAPKSLRMVVMNTCDSASQARSLVNVVDASIGMTRSVGDDAARTFAAQLYSSLAEGITLAPAFDQARLQVRLAGLAGDDIPALFIRRGLDSNELAFAR